MTTPNPTENSAELLVRKTGELGEKTLGLTRSVAETIGKRVRALDALRENQGITADPKRMQAIADGLFEAVDLLIFLAEDIQGAARRTERTQSDEAKPKSKRAVETNEINRDEQELLTMLQGMEGEPVSVEYLLENGFGISLSTDRDVRKRRLQKCLDTLAQKLTQTGADQQLLKEGRTRGTKYSLVGSGVMQVAVQPNDNDEQAEVTYAHLVEPVLAEDLEPETQPVAEPPVHIEQPEVEVRKEDPLKELVGMTIDTIMRKDEKRPYLCIQDIVRIGFQGRRLEQEEFQQLREHTDTDHRLEKVAFGEYHIIGRDTEERWIDRGALRDSVNTFIENMTRWNSTEESLVNLFKAAGRTNMWLTSPERNELVSILKADYRVVSVTAGNFSIDTTRTEKNDPNRHLRGMSPAELDKALGKLGMKGGAAFRRRR